MKNTWVLFLLVITPIIALGGAAVHLENRIADGRRMAALVDKVLDEPYRPIIVLTDDNLLQYPVMDPEMHKPHVKRYIEVSDDDFENATVRKVARP